MSEMIDRVAKAIGDHYNAYCDPVDTPETWASAVVAAKAAIEAMREPTDDMKNCSEEVHWGYSCGECGGLTEGWRAMIDAALIDSRQPETKETP